MRDLDGFDVERATDFDYTVVGTVTLTDQTRFQKERTITWTDASAAIGTAYRYRIIAKTIDGYHSTPSEPVTLEHRPGTTAEAPPKPAPRPARRPKP
jgi:hypothetical protein